MKVPTKIVFAFDYKNSNIPAFSDKRGLILWGCIKSNHITSQHFNGNVQDVVLRMNSEKPKNYQEFRNIIITSGLSIFGTVCEKSKIFGFQLYPSLDDEYWQGMWAYLTEEKKLDIIINKD